MILKSYTNDETEMRNQELEIKDKALFSLLISAALLFFFASASMADSYNNIKARIDGDTTTFTIEVKDAEVKDVLRALAKQNNLNIIVSEDITAKATFSFDRIKFKDALEVITKANGLNYVIQNNVLWIGKKEDIAKAGEDIVIEIVQFNYSKAADVVGQLKGVLSERGSAVPDSRTNTIILRDMKKNIEDARLLIKSLDTRTMQVVIEARIIEVQSNFARDMGVQWGVAHGTTNRDNFTSAFGSSSTAPPSTSTPTGFIGSGRPFSSQPNYAVHVPASGTAGVLGALGLSFGKLSGDRLLLDLR